MFENRLFGFVIVLSLTIKWFEQLLFMKSFVTN